MFWGRDTEPKNMCVMFVCSDFNILPEYFLYLFSLKEIKTVRIELPSSFFPTLHSLTQLSFPLVHTQQGSTKSHIFKTYTFQFPWTQKKASWLWLCVCVQPSYLIISVVSFSAGPGWSCGGAKWDSIVVLPLIILQCWKHIIHIYYYTCLPLVLCFKHDSTYSHRRPSPVALPHQSPLSLTSSFW